MKAYLLIECPFCHETAHISEFDGRNWVAVGAVDDFSTVHRHREERERLVEKYHWYCDWDQADLLAERERLLEEEPLTKNEWALLSDYWPNHPISVFDEEGRKINSLTNTTLWESGPSDGSWMANRGASYVVEREQPKPNSIMGMAMGDRPLNYKDDEMIMIPPLWH